MRIGLKAGYIPENIVAYGYRHCDLGGKFTVFDQRQPMVAVRPVAALLLFFTVILTLQWSELVDDAAVVAVVRRSGKHFKEGVFQHYRLLQKLGCGIGNRLPAATGDND